MVRSGIQLQYEDSADSDVIRSKTKISSSDINFERRETLDILGICTFSIFTSRRTQNTSPVFKILSFVRQEDIDYVTTSNLSTESCLI